MGLDVKQLGLYVVRPTLAALAAAAPGIDGPVAEALLLGTAAQESQFRSLHQEGGPALGLWQMEPATAKDLWRWLLDLPGAGRGLYTAMRLIARATVPDPSLLVADLSFACAMARLLYWRDPEALPHVDIAHHAFRTAEIPLALWPTYKRVWNSSKGKATQQEFIRNWMLVAPIAPALWPES